MGYRSTVTFLSEQDTTQALENITHVVKFFNDYAQKHKKSKIKT